MYKVLVRDNQFADKNITIFDVMKHFSERAEIEVPTADMIFIIEQKKIIGVITKALYDKVINENIPFDTPAFEYSDKSYPVITEEEADEYVQKHAQIDTPVLGSDGLPKYVILKGYINDGRSQHYYCNVLAGLSTYHLSVNADMTVSCNCKLRGCGMLGNLREQSLGEIYDSETAVSWRHSLANGFLPTAACAFRCTELVRSPKSIANFYKDNYSVPTVIMFENTSYCNLKCEGCYNRYIEKCTVSVDDTRLFANECKKHNIKTIFMFKYGESFFDKDFSEKVAVIREILPGAHLSTSTNGVLINNEKAYDAAMMLDSITFSLDGVDDESVTAFQKNGTFDTVYNNMCELVRRRKNADIKKPRLLWKYVLFTHNDSEENINKAIELAIASGIDNLQFIPGFNNIKRSGVIWKSDVFSKYLRKFKFTYANSLGSLTFHLDKPIDL
jgi:MoaA/NifB/PqqE/SkfB family radical SAM enzyme